MQLPVIKGCPSNVAVAFGPLWVASSLSTLPDTTEINVLTDVDIVVVVEDVNVAVAPLPEAIESPDGEQPTKFGAVRLTAMHSCWLN